MAYKSDLSKKTVVIVGCGGLGGYVIEELARMGVGTLRLVDGDRFSVSNLNRQLMATSETLGKYKTKVYEKRLKTYFSGIVEIFTQFFDENGAEILDGADLAMDCLDSVKCRKTLFAECQKRGIPMVHGAVEGDEGQVALLPPNSPNLNKLFGGAQESEHSTNCCAVAAVATVQASLAVKTLSGEAADWQDKLILIDTENLFVRAVDIC